jgi:hypothetical protein
MPLLLRKNQQTSHNPSAERRELRCHLKRATVAPVRTARPDSSTPSRPTVTTTTKHIQRLLYRKLLSWEGRQGADNRSGRKASSSFFEKKEPKKLLSICGHRRRSSRLSARRVQGEKSFFASFFQKKKTLAFPYRLPSFFGFSTGPATQDSQNKIGPLIRLCFFAAQACYILIP